MQAILLVARLCSDGCDTCVPLPDPGPPSTNTMLRAACVTGKPAVERSMSCKQAHDVLLAARHLGIAGQRCSFA